MSPKNHREDWRWVPVFDPKTGHTISSTEGDFEEDYQVEETYTAIDDEEDDDDEFDDSSEEENEALVYQNEEEDED